MFGKYAPWAAGLCALALLFPVLSGFLLLLGANPTTPPGGTAVGASIVVFIVAGLTTASIYFVTKVPGLAMAIYGASAVALIATRNLGSGEAIHTQLIAAIGLLALSAWAAVEVNNRRQARPSAPSA